MPNIEERERYFEKIINRWENEGGAIARLARHLEMVDEEVSSQNLAKISNDHADGGKLR